MLSYWYLDIQKVKTCIKMEIIFRKKSYQKMKTQIWVILIRFDRELYPLC